MYKLIAKTASSRVEIMSKRSIEEIDQYTSSFETEEDFISALAKDYSSSLTSIELLFITKKSNQVLDIMYRYDIFDQDSVRRSYYRYLLSYPTLISSLISGSYHTIPQNRYDQLCQELMNLDPNSLAFKNGFDTFINIYFQSYRRSRDAYFECQELGIPVKCYYQRNNNQRPTISSSPIPKEETTNIGYATDDETIYQILTHINLNQSYETMVKLVFWQCVIGFPQYNIPYIQKHLIPLHQHNINNDNLFNIPYHKVYFDEYLKGKEITFSDLFGGVFGLVPKPKARKKTK